VTNPGGARARGAALLATLGGSVLLLGPGTSIAAPAPGPEAVVPAVEVKKETPPAADSTAVQQTRHDEVGDPPAASAKPTSYLAPPPQAPAPAKNGKAAPPSPGIIVGKPSAIRKAPTKDEQQRARQPARMDEKSAVQEAEPEKPLRKDLMEKLAAGEQKLRARAGNSPVNPAALEELEELRARAQAMRTDAERQAVENARQAWEKKYLPAP
jgi:hypothetical protein